MARRKVSPPKLSARQKFERFIDRAIQLDQQPLVSERQGFQFTFKTNSQAQVASHTLTEPKPSDFRAYLIDLRKFLLKNEPIFIEYIMQEALRSIRNDTVNSASERVWKWRVPGNSIRV